MYAPNLRTRDRGGAIAAVAAIHVGLLFALLNISGTIRLAPDQPDLVIFDLDTAEPPPPPVVEVQSEEERAPEEEGEASPPNIESQASPVVAPEPEIIVPRPPPVTASPTPNEGAEPTQGAAPVPGPGTGAGGVGTGTGAGGSGSGTGGGGGGQATSPSIIRGISRRDYPDAIARRWPRNGRIFVRLRIETNGRPSQCDVMRSYGDRLADQWTCSLLMERGQFRPATDTSGRPMAAWYGYIQAPTGIMERR